MSDKYSTWKERAEKHDAQHEGLSTTRLKQDFSCKICHPLLVTNRRFIRFWKWYQKEIPQAIECTGKTEQVFTEYLACINQPQTKDRDNRIKGKIGKLLGCIRYHDRPQLTEKEIRQRLIEITVASEDFEKSVKKAEELWEKYVSSEASLSSGTIETIDEYGPVEEDLWYESSKA